MTERVTTFRGCHNLLVARLSLLQFKPELQSGSTEVRGPGRRSGPGSGAAAAGAAVMVRATAYSDSARRIQVLAAGYFNRVNPSRTITANWTRR